MIKVTCVQELATRLGIYAIAYALGLELGASATRRDLLRCCCCSAIDAYNVQDFYQQLKAQMGAELRQAVETERAITARKLHMKQREIELLKDDLAVLRKGQESSEIVVGRACDQIAVLNEQWRERRILRQYFLGWRSVKWKARKIKLTAKADEMCGPVWPF